ncbi:MAG: replication-associated recombination protein A [Ruminococcaceae bacterium]|nr:replication-associated recombination protein A [Oscillospiraceae bacterium]
MNVPLAQRLRPKSLDQVCGQKHLLGENGILRRYLDSNKVGNMIFYGPSGTGKTTVAQIIAQNCQMTFHKLNGTTASGADIKAVLEESSGIFGSDGVLLYLDELQYLNRKQQQILLEYIEDGRVTLIASTTENPYFYIYKAILSRCAVFEFKEVQASDVLLSLQRALDFLNLENKAEKSAEKDALWHVASCCGGDVRKAINTLELLYLSCQDTLTLSDAQALISRSLSGYDREGDDKFELMSALQKSIRGSDPDAAVFYLAKLLDSGDIISACRRLMVIAAEDVGLAYPNGVVVTKSCVDCALQLGMPEAGIPLAQAAVLLATSPKSNSSYLAYHMALDDVKAGKGSDMPSQLKNNHFFGEGDKKNSYLYPHDYPNHFVKQQYLPDDIKDRVYYHFGENKQENAAKEYWKKIKG